eukprot:CAMPEP_0196782760 /NCGR_PEP_ID=MMETSP1104-20130614/12017_1 /TAXON_ID=33652 /ORGANISM="Cafeteria sp., Strain Caron Lab Isolate" /LENGTH=202 /DNA_ID=CAMNT_0042153003 /DNA_START=61 /DNA_END=669 /DNA_ORIENTATION=-
MPRTLASSDPIRVVHTDAALSTEVAAIVFIVIVFRVGAEDVAGGDEAEDLDDAKGEDRHGGRAELGVQEVDDRVLEEGEVAAIVGGHIVKQLAQAGFLILRLAALNVRIVERIVELALGTAHEFGAAVALEALDLTHPVQKHHRSGHLEHDQDKEAHRVQHEHEAPDALCILQRAAAASKGQDEDENAGGDEHVDPLTRDHI